MSQDPLLSEHPAWLISGLLALSVHLLVLCSEESPSSKRAAWVSEPARWERETWEVLAPPSAQPEPARKREPESYDLRRRSGRVGEKRRAIRLVDTVSDFSVAREEAWMHEARHAPQVVEWGRPRSRVQRYMGVFAALVHSQDDHCDRPCEQLGADSLDSSRVVATYSGASAETPARASSALVRVPRLLTTKNLCAGYFPATATAAHGRVELMMDVDPQGSPHSTQVLFELPIGQGFEGAARACASHFHFAPALDMRGHPVGGHARIALRFERM